MHIFVDEIFENGKIRQIPHNFDQSLLIDPTPNNNASHLRPPLKKIFIKNSINRHSMLGCISKESQNESLQNMTMVEIKSSNECYEKNNSTCYKKNGLSAYEKLYVINKTRKDTNIRRSFSPYKHSYLGSLPT